MRTKSRRMTDEKQQPRLGKAHFWTESFDAENFDVKILRWRNCRADFGRTHKRYIEIREKDLQRKEAAAVARFWRSRNERGSPDERIGENGQVIGVAPTNKRAPPQPEFRDRRGKELPLAELSHFNVFRQQCVFDMHGQPICEWQRYF